MALSAAALHTPATLQQHLSALRRCCGAARPLGIVGGRHPATALASPSAAVTASASATAQRVHGGTAGSRAVTSGAGSGAGTGASSSNSNSSSGGGAPRAHAMQDTINLTDEERALFDTLLAAASFAGTNTVLRAAGGWVRDKLLGKDSKDIDIALDNMLGKDFAEKVNEYLAAQGKETRTAAVIQSNPEQSKHLETARMKVNALWIDLVNLRSETYADGSRIPTMEFGTPLQDAERRDFTINSLFYNLNAGVVEDFTGRGLDDLRQGVLRTPLPPLQTFLDDPLRVMRAVRFSTRFGFPPEPAILEAASTDEVRTALGSKVSRERIGTELQGMFDGAAPTAAVRLLHQLQLMPQVFTLPPQAAQQAGTGYGGPCVEVMAAAEALVGALDLQLSVEERRVLLLAALLLPLRKLAVPGKGNKTAPVSSHIIREAIKWRSKDAEAVALLHTHACDLAAVHRQLSGTEPAAAPAELRVQLGRAIRQLKATWKLGAVLVPLLQLPAAAPLGVEPGSDEAAPDSNPAAAAAAAASTAAEGSPGQPKPGSAADAAGAAAAGGGAAQQQQQQADAVRSLLAAATGFGLEECWQWKPLLDGKQLIELLNVPKGPMLGKLTATVLEWQMANPGGSKEECVETLKQHVQQQQQQGG